MLINLKTLFLILILMSLTGCISTIEEYDNLSLDIVEASSYEEKLEQPKKDTLEEVIAGLTDKKIEFQKAYVAIDLAPTYTSSTSATINKHIARGSLLYLYEEKDTRFSISADQEYPLWINEKHICYTENCWISPKTSVSTTNKTLLNNKLLEKKYPTQLSQASNSTTSKKNASTSNGSGKGYINKDGKFVPSPTKSNTPPDGATTKCKDNTWSSSQNLRGTCSGHEGVTRWL